MQLLLVRSLKLHVYFYLSTAMLPSILAKNFIYFHIKFLPCKMCNPSKILQVYTIVYTCSFVMGLLSYSRWKFSNLKLNAFPLLIHINWSYQVLGWMASPRSTVRIFVITWGKSVLVIGLAASVKNTNKSTYIERLKVPIEKLLGDIRSP